MIIDNELQLFEATKKETEEFRKNLMLFLTIKPTSVEVERAFSALGFCYQDQKQAKR